MAKRKLKRYKKLIISHDCLVPKGAMEVESVFKEVDGITEFTKIKSKAVFKLDDSEQMIFNVMVKWNDPDSQDWILDDAGVRRDTLIDYQANGDKVLKFTHKKDDDGEPFDIDAHVVETYIVKENDHIFPEYVGSIARSAYFADADEYDLIKEMEFETSIEGKALLEEFEIEEETVKDKTNKAIHKIKDLLKTTFKFEDGKLTKKSFLTILEDVTKDFDSVVANNKNTDVYFATSALQTAVFNAEWDYLYSGTSDIPGFKKEVGKMVKQFTKYINEMSFEVVTKDIVTEIKKGEEVMLEKAEVQKMIDDSLKTAIGLEEGQTVADLIKTTSEKSPPELVVKDAEGNVVKDKDGKDVTLVGLVTKMDESFSAFKTEVSTYMTANPEKVLDPVDNVVEKEETDSERKAKLAM